MQGSVHVVVVGGGLFGAAAARHLAEAGRRVTVVASPEPVDQTYASATGPLASHYDQGRIVRTGGSDELGAALAQASFGRYPDLALRSGIPFFRQHPLITLTSEPALQLQRSLAVGADVQAIGSDELATSTGIVTPTGFDGAAIIETATAGIVNPRLLVLAQLHLAQSAGATLIEGQAVGVDADASGVRVTTAADGQIKAEQLVLATGAYGIELLGFDLPAPQPTQHRLTIQRRLRTIALIEVDGPTDILPSLSAGGFLHPSPANPKLEEMYWVPPVRYPDGGLYLKIGGNSLPMNTASGNDDIGAWFRAGGSSTEADALFVLACDLLPQRELRLAGHKPCVVSYTADEQPIVERVDERVVLSLAGNGSGATIGDEVGRRAAALAANI